MNKINFKKTNKQTSVINLQQLATLRNNLVPGNESKLLQKSSVYKEMVCHMKDHVIFSDFSKFEKVCSDFGELASFRFPLLRVVFLVVET